MQVKTAMKYLYLIPVGIGTAKGWKTINAGKNVEMTLVGMQITMVIIENSVGALRKLKIDLLYVSVIQCMGHMWGMNKSMKEILTFPLISWLRNITSVLQKYSCSNDTEKKSISGWLEKAYVWLDNEILFKQKE